jgi:hypothetical protein
MRSGDTDGLPPFPPSPSSVPRRDHLPTVEASIRYWDAVRVRALRSGDDDRVRTATALKLSYEEAHRELTARGKTNRPPIG